MLVCGPWKIHLIFRSLEWHLGGHYSKSMSWRGETEWWGKCIRGCGKSVSDYFKAGQILKAHKHTAWAGLVPKKSSNRCLSRTTTPSEKKLQPCVKIFEHMNTVTVKNNMKIIIIVELFPQCPSLRQCAICPVKNRLASFCWLQGARTLWGGVN